jgi:hypothetical protein
VSKRAARLAKWLPRTIQALQRLLEALADDLPGDAQRWATSASIGTQKVCRYASAMAWTDRDRAAVAGAISLAGDWRHALLADVERLLLLRGLSRTQVNTVGPTLAIFAAAHPGDAQPGTLAHLGRAVEAAVRRQRTHEGGPA